MAILKEGGYGNDFKIVTGDEEFDNEMGDQLSLSKKELLTAINAENVTDRLFNRIMKARSEKHQTLLKKIPGAGQ